MTSQELTTVDPQAVQVADLIAEWHTELKHLVAANEMAATTATTYRIGMRKFSNWRAMPDHASQTVREWKEAMLTTAKPGSVNVWLAGVRAFYAWAVETGRMAYDPTAGVKGAKRRGASQHHKRDALSDTEVRRLLALPLSKRDRAVILISLYTGARQSELSRADMAGLRTKDGAQVLSVQGKGHAEVDDFVVIAHPNAQAALYEWLKERGGAPGPLFTSQATNMIGARLSVRAIRRIVKDAYKDAGIVGERKTTHSLRHTAITNILRNGGSLQQAQATARHSNIATTGIYVHELDRIGNAGERLIDYGTEGAK